MPSFVWLCVDSTQRRSSGDCILQCLVRGSLFEVLLVILSLCFFAADQLYILNFLINAAVVHDLRLSFGQP